MSASGLEQVVQTTKKVVAEIGRTVRELATTTGNAVPLPGGGHEHRTPDAPRSSGRKAGDRREPRA